MKREIKYRAWDESGDKPYMLGPYDLTDSIFNHKDIRSLNLMEFTGLKDLNGKEIYEGDIFKYQLLDVTGDDEPDTYTEYTEEVIFEDGQFAVEIMPLFAACQEGEVIGNIYENPELINSK